MRGKELAMRSVVRFLVVVLCIPFMLTFMLAPCQAPENSDFQRKNWISPREFELWEIAETGQINRMFPFEVTFGSKAEEAILHSPDWLKTDLMNQFFAMGRSYIKGSPESTFSVGDLDADGMRDLLFCDGSMMLSFYKAGYHPGKSALKLMGRIPLPSFIEKPFFFTLLDLDQRGYSDLFISTSSAIYYLKNNSNQKSLKFSEAQELYRDPVKSYSWRISSIIMHDIPCLILGNQDGSLSGLAYMEKKWQLQKDFFPSWMENENGIATRKGVFASSFANPVTHMLPDGKVLLVVSGGAGDLSSYAITGNPAKIESYTLLRSETAPYVHSMAFMDVNSDTRADLVYLCHPDPITVLLNNGNDAMDHWIRLTSFNETLSPPHQERSDYHGEGDILFASGHHVEEIETCAEFIINTPSPYIDEVVYCLSHFQTSDLLQYLRFQQLPVLLENAQRIYEMASRVSYVEILENKDHTTLRYATKEEWKEMPRFIYYHYLVMLNRYLFIPEDFNSVSEGKFFRSYLPEDKTYTQSLFSRVSEAKTLEEAAWKVLYWLKQDIGAVWRRGEKPLEWYQIYHHLLNKEKGLWCGEFSIIYEASARAMNIPVVIVAAMGEDHQFNNFWAEEWKHVDASAGENTNLTGWEEYYSDQQVYYRNWKDRVFSWPAVIDRDGVFDHVSRSQVLYYPTEDLQELRFFVTDLEGNPIDGARIELRSRWAIEAGKQQEPLLSAIAYTDTKGECRLKKVARQNLTISVISRIGSTQISLPLESVKAQEIIPVTIPSIPPTLFHPQPSLEPLMDPDTPQKVKQIKLISNTMDVQQYDRDSSKGYLRAQVLADLVDLDVQYLKQKNQLLCTYQQHTIRFHANNKELILGNKHYFFETYPFKVIHNRPYLSLSVINRLFFVTSSFDDKSNTLELRYRPSTKFLLSLRMDCFQQTQIPWDSFHFTHLNYLEHWRSPYGLLDVWVLDQDTLPRFLAGKEINKGYYYQIDKDRNWKVEVPMDASYPLYLVVYNPSLCTSARYELEATISVP